MPKNTSFRFFDADCFFIGEARPKEKQKAIDAGASEYFVKPNDLEKLTQTVIDLIEKQ